MFTLPQLIEEDIQELQGVLADLNAKTEASTGLVIDKAGFIVATMGETESFDTTTLAALAAASYTANQAIANLIQEPNFSTVYQQGERFSLLVSNIDEHCLLVVVFRAQLSAGAVKYFANYAIKRIAQQMDKAKKRAPNEGLDLAMANMSDPSPLFQKRQ